MSKYVKNIIVLVVLGTLAFFYAHTDIASRLYDKEIDASEYTVLALNSTNTMEQHFQLDQTMMDGFDIMFANAKQNFEINYTITRESDKKTIAQGKIHTTELKNDKFYKVRFPQQESEKGIFYVLKLEVQGKTNTIDVNVCKAQKPNEKEMFFVNGKAVEGTLVAKIVSHQFDMKTFIVLLSFILFIILFMKSLYRLFNE